MKIHKNKTLKKYTVVCLDEDGEACESLVHALRGICGSVLAVIGFSDTEKAFEWLRGPSGTDFDIAILIVACSGDAMHAINFIASVRQMPNFQTSKTILLDNDKTTNRKALSDGDEIDEFLYRTRNLNELKKKVRRLLADYFIQNDPDFIEEITALANEARISRRLLAQTRHQDNMLRSPAVSLNTFVKNGDLEENATEARRMVDEIDKTLGSSNKMNWSEGDILFHEGNRLDGIWIILSGRVSLFRKIDSVDIIFHSNSVGQILGQLPLSLKNRRSSFTCEAVTDTTLIYLSLDELNKMLECNSVFAGYFLTVLLRSLTLRNRRAVELQIEINTLNRALGNERDQLKRALKQLEQAQMRLVESGKMASLGGLVAGISHEMNTPIGISVTAASLLADETRTFNSAFQSGAMKKSDLINYIGTCGQSTKMILSNLTRASELIQSFKHVAVDQSGEDRRVFNVNEYLQEILLSLSPKLKKTKHIISIDSDPTIKMDSYPGTFSQIITNLILNSLLHAYDDDEEGRLTIEIKKDNGHLSIKFSDNGKGMEKKILNQVFDPFFTTKRGQGGSGLGLYLVYNCVTQKLKGTIHCESNVKKGTTFYFNLPEKFEGIERGDENETCKEAWNP